MTRIDAGGAILALLMGFVRSAGLTGFVLAAGGYQFAAPAPRASALPGPAIAAPAAPAAQAQAPAQAALAAQVAGEVKVVATDLKLTPTSTCGSGPSKPT